MFDQAIALSNIGNSECKAWGLIFQSRRYTVGMIFFVSLVQMCITILKGFIHFFPKDEEVVPLQEIGKDDHVLMFLLYAIKSQLCIQSNRFEESLREVNAAIVLMNVISIENTEMIYGILLIILSLYSIFESEVLARKDTGSTGGRIFSNIMRRISKVTGGKRSSAKRESSLPFSETLDRNGSNTAFESNYSNISNISSPRISAVSPRLSAVSAKLYDDFERSELNLSHIVHSYSERVSKLLGSMPCHFLVQKLHILMRALERRSDPGFASFSLNTMREEAKRLLNGKETKTKYLAVVYLMKSSKIYEKSEESRTLANKICSENKIQTCLNIL